MPSTGCNDRHGRGGDCGGSASEVLLNFNSDTDENYLTLNLNIDPATLCPWYDEQLPLPTNSLGLQAVLGVFIHVCQRHRLKSHQLSHAQLRGWPTQNNWEDIGAHVEALQAQLEAIIEDVDESFLPGKTWTDKDEDEDEEANFEGHSRKGSIFWRDVTRSIKKNGLWKTTSTLGHYGELGFAIIHQKFCNLFPPTSFNPDSVLPVMPINFIQLILVPEAVVSLIMEDLALDCEATIRTMWDSAEYGVTMFPDDGADAINAGEQIIMA
ncbi:hypothetical protein A0H81_08629 [Grifola frondosa]|uniref:Restriction of telomere capping protein 4 n=1 Tax=Grifola frondosa TaxID=5627 RepID=A0A1C7M9K2_GRIFR|nr:hypothetical protein A0H81_08629 [Grifola frondosa]